MFSEEYLPNIERFEIELKDKLGRDPRNENIKSLLILIDRIKKSFYNRKQIPYDLAIIERLFKEDISNEEYSALREYVEQSPGDIKEELLFFIDNRELIEELKTHLEAERKVKKAAKDFFNDNNGKEN